MKKVTKRWIGLWTASAFLLQTLLPFVAIYDANAATTVNHGKAGASPSLIGDKILICTSEGFQWFSWKDLQSGKAKPKAQHHYKCPLCFVAAHNAKALVSHDAYVLSTMQSQRSAVIVARLSASSHAPWRYKLFSHAPPSYLA